MTLSERLKMTPFDLFREDCGEVIAIINHFVEKGQRRTAGNKLLRCMTDFGIF